MMMRHCAEDVAAYIKAHNCGTLVGVDEAGRGTWAGSIFAAAAAVPTSWKAPADVRDSKKLGSSDRGRAEMERIYERYANHDRIAIGIGVVSSEEIDDIGLDKAQAKAQGLAIRATFDRLVYPPFVVVDGINPPAIDPSDIEALMCVPKADALIPAVSLASIFAKVTQLRAMRELDAQFPSFGFLKHAGYGTKEHKAALDRLGPCPIHRRSFRPIKDAFKTNSNGVTDLDALLEELM